MRDAASLLTPIMTKRQNKYCPTAPKAPSLSRSLILIADNAGCRKAAFFSSKGKFPTQRVELSTIFSVSSTSRVIDLDFFPPEDGSASGGLWYSLEPVPTFVGMSRQKKVLLIPTYLVYPLLFTFRAPFVSTNARDPQGGLLLTQKSRSTGSRSSYGCF